MERSNTLQELQAEFLENEPVEPPCVGAERGKTAAQTAPPLSLTDYGFNPLTQRYVLRRNAVWMRLVKSGKVKDEELAAEMRTLEEARTLARRAAFAAPTGLSGIMQARAKQKRDAMTRTLAAGEPPDARTPAANGLSLAERVAQDHADVLTALPRPEAKRVLAALIRAAAKSPNY